jgi:hypothetical protein
MLYNFSVQVAAASLLVTLWRAVLPQLHARSAFMFAVASASLLRCTTQHTQSCVLTKYLHELHCISPRLSRFVPNFTAGSLVHRPTSHPSSNDESPTQAPQQITRFLPAFRHRLYSVLSCDSL